MIATRLVIDIKTQTLVARAGDVELARYPVSTAMKGAGEQNGSLMTPRGKHRIRAKIGAGLPAGAVFVGRRFTGEIYAGSLAAAFPQRDWILSRILWLCGMQPGVNRFGSVDSMRRYIYIHGCPDSEPMGVPYSHGCIRMRNQDIMALFECVDTHTEVCIVEDMAASEWLLRTLSARHKGYLDSLRDQTRYYSGQAVARQAEPTFYLVWDQWGERLASCRLCLEGIVDELRADPTKPQALQKLLAAVIARAAEIGWYEVRVMAVYTELGLFQSLGWMPVGDPFTLNGQRYQQCRYIL